MYLKAYDGVPDAKANLAAYLRFYNERRPHSSLDGMNSRMLFISTVGRKTGLRHDRISQTRGRSTYRILLRLVGRGLRRSPWITHYRRAPTCLAGIPVQLTGATSERNLWSRAAVRSPTARAASWSKQSEVRQKAEHQCPSRHTCAISSAMGSAKKASQRACSAAVRRTACSSLRRPVMAALGAFTRDLMGHMERDLSTKLDWTAIAHWNTEHPQILHILILCTADDG